MTLVLFQSLIVAYQMKGIEEQKKILKQKWPKKRINFSLVTMATKNAFLCKIQAILSLFYINKHKIKWQML